MDTDNTKEILTDQIDLTASPNSSQLLTIEKCDNQNSSHVESQNLGSNNHNRRKRSRMSPRPTQSNENDSAIYESGNVENIDLMNLGNHDIACPDSVIHSEKSNVFALETTSLEALILTRIDPEFRELIFKYVRSEQVIRCLELAGFCTPYVLARLDELQIQRLEDFVGHTCSLMKSITLRENFMGPIFSHNPLQFRLPSGAACGLFLAASEIRKKYQKSFINAINWSAVDEETSNMYEQSLNDASCQTDVSCHTLSNESHPNSEMAVANSSCLNNANSSENNELLQCSKNNFESPNGLFKLDNNITSTSVSTVAMMAAALQAAAVVNGTSKTEKCFSQNDINVNPSNGLNSLTANDQGTSCSTVATIKSPVCGIVSPTVNSQNNSISNLPNGSFDDEAVDLERLKQHSSASAIRLASRQFLNAHLMRGREFDMEMELSITPEGCKRVTGIFFCHLCREKRERTSAVRFSIARNRYPVLSNVLSHLKTHFHYRGQMLSASQVLQQTSNILKSTNMLNDSFLGHNMLNSGGINPHLIPNFRPDINDDHTLNNSSSGSPFLAPSISLSRFSSHVKHEPATFPFGVDSENADDHAIFNHLSPATNSLSAQNHHKSSPAHRNHSIHGLELEVNMSTQ